MWASTAGYNASTSFSAVLQREIDGRSTFAADTELMRLQRTAASDYSTWPIVVTQPLTEAVRVPPFAVAFAKRAANAHVLAVGDEAGCVSFVDSTQSSARDGAWSTAHRTAALCHKNTIFDLSWMDGDTRLATASGDHTIKVWDTASAAYYVRSASVGSGSLSDPACAVATHTPRCLYTLIGHRGSVKSVRPRLSGASDVLVSGSRDGHVQVWDTRVPPRPLAASPSLVSPRPTDGSAMVTPIATIGNAHTTVTGFAPVGKRAASTTATAAATKAGKTRRRPSQHTATNTATTAARHSVTGVLFVGEHTIASAGAVDGVVKLWDLRYLQAKSSLRSKATGVTPVTALEPVALLSPFAAAASPAGSAALASRRHGITSLDVNRFGTSLIASSVDHNIYQFDLQSAASAASASASASASATPTVVASRAYTGHRCETFYVRTTFSPCGRYIASGSSNSLLYVWDTLAPPQPSATAAVLDASSAAALESGLMMGPRASSSPLRGGGGGRDAASASTAVTPILALAGHLHECTSVAWSSAAIGTLASCSDDSTVRVWAPLHTTHSIAIAARASPTANNTSASPLPSTRPAAPQRVDHRPAVFRGRPLLLPSARAVATASPATSAVHCWPTRFGPPVPTPSSAAPMQVVPAPLPAMRTPSPATAKVQPMALVRRSAFLPRTTALDAAAAGDAVSARAVASTPASTPTIRRSLVSAFGQSPASSVATPSGAASSASSPSTAAAASQLSPSTVSGSSPASAAAVAFSDSPWSSASGLSPHMCSALSSTAPLSPLRSLSDRPTPASASALATLSAALTTAAPALAPATNRLKRKHPPTPHAHDSPSKPAPFTATTATAAPRPASPDAAIPAAKRLCVPPAPQPMGPAAKRVSPSKAALLRAASAVGTHSLKTLWSRATAPAAGDASSAAALLRRRVRASPVRLDDAVV